MEDTILSLWADYKSKFDSAPGYTIDFYKRNFILFNNISSFKDKEALTIYIHFICNYSDCLYKKGHYNEAVDFIITQQIFIDKEIERLSADELKDDWYHSISFVKGKASYGLKDYKTATKIFKALLVQDPKNDLTKSWLTNSQYGTKLWVINIITIVCFCLMFVEIILGKKIPSFTVRWCMISVALIGVMASQGYELYIQRSMRKSGVNKM